MKNSSNKTDKQTKIDGEDAYLEREKEKITRTDLHWTSEIQKKCCERAGVQREK